MGALSENSKFDECLTVTSNYASFNAVPVQNTQKKIPGK